MLLLAISEKPSGPVKLINTSAGSENFPSTLSVIIKSFTLKPVKEVIRVPDVLRKVIEHTEEWHSFHTFLYIGLINVVLKSEVNKLI